MKDLFLLMKSPIPIVFLVNTFLLACDEGENLSQRMGKISEGIKKVDSSAEKVSERLGVVSENLGRYMDTTRYYKDSLGHWHKKE